MKDYINLFHSIVSEVHFWDEFENEVKKKKISEFLKNFSQIDDLVDYFNKFNENLSKKTLNSYIKSVITP